MKIDLVNDKKLTNEILDKYSLEDVLVFSTSTAGAQGMPNHIEAVVKTGDAIELYSGVHENEKDSALTTEKVEKFFYPIIMDNIENTGWYWLNMGLGNSLCVREILVKEYLEKYEELIQQLPFILYATWRTFTDYILNKKLNNIELTDKINQVDNEIKEIKEEYF